MTSTKPAIGTKAALLSLIFDAPLETERISIVGAALFLIARAAGPG